MNSDIAQLNKEDLIKELKKSRKYSEDLESDIEPAKAQKSEEDARLDILMIRINELAIDNVMFKQNTKSKEQIEDLQSRVVESVDRLDSKMMGHNKRHDDFDATTSTSNNQRLDPLPGTSDVRLDFFAKSPTNHQDKVESLNLDGPDMPLIIPHMPVVDTDFLEILGGIPSSDMTEEYTERLAHWFISKTRFTNEKKDPISQFIILDEEIRKTFSTPPKMPECLAFATKYPDKMKDIVARQTEGVVYVCELGFLLSAFKGKRGERMKFETSIGIDDTNGARQIWKFYHGTNTYNIRVAFMDGFRNSHIKLMLPTMRILRNTEL